MSSEYFRNKITFLNVVLTIMIVVLHAKSPERFGLALEDYPVIYSVSTFCRVATPLFFFVSALLFFNGCGFDQLKRKYKSRIRTLLIPYILWNLIFAGLFWFMSHTPAIAAKLNIGDILNTPKEFLIAVLNSYHTDLWFVRNLMFYCLLAPVFLLVFRNRNISFVLLLASVVLAVCLEPQYKSLLRWLPIYQMGAMCGYFRNDAQIGKFVYDRHGKGFTVASIAILTASYVLSWLTDNDIYLIYTSPILIWFIVDGVFHHRIQDLKVKRWMNYMFFIFCTHHFLLNVLEKVAVLYCEPSRTVVFMTYVVSPVLCILILIKVADWISRYKVYKVLTGGR